MATHTVSVQLSITVKMSCFVLYVRNSDELLTPICFLFTSASDELVIEAEEKGEQQYNVAINMYTAWNCCDLRVN